MKNILVIIFLFVAHASFAQKNKNIDSILWNYKEVSEIEANKLHTFYKIDEYDTDFRNNEQFLNSFEQEGVLYLQMFVVVPVVQENKDSLPSFSAEDTLMMFQNEDYSYRGLPFMVYERPQAFAWECLVFEKQIDLSLSKPEIDYQTYIFEKRIVSGFYENVKSKKIEYFERIDSGYLYDNCMKAFGDKKPKKPILFIPKYEPFK